MYLQTIWIYSAILLSAHCLSWVLCSATNTSTLRSPVEHVFSRRKRWLLFPKGTALKFTVTTSKRLLAIYPRGLNFVVEAASYYPMPTARIDLIPKRFRKPTTKAPSPPGPTPLTLIGIPGSLIKYSGRPAVRPMLVQRLDQNVSDIRWVTQSKQPPPPPPHKWNKYATLGNSNKQYWSRGKYQDSEYNKNYMNTKWKNHFNNYEHWSRSGRDLEYFDDNGHEQYFDDLENFKISPHYHAHRSRRDLFARLEDFKHVLGIDMKSCILRAMCDSKRFLLPPGYSMVQDILRVVLTFPTINGLRDDYSYVMASDYGTCDSFLHNKCHLSLLGWFLNTKKSV